MIITHEPPHDWWFTAPQNGSWRKENRHCHHHKENSKDIERSLILSLMGLLAALTGTQMPLVPMPRERVWNLAGNDINFLLYQISAQLEELYNTKYAPCRSAR